MRDYEKEEERHQFSAKVECERWQAILPIQKIVIDSVQAAATFTVQ